jgi:hypothetical protein
MIAAGGAGNPKQSGFLSAGAQISRGQGVEAAAGDVELIGGLRGLQGALRKGFEHSADKRRRMTAEQLLVIFKKRRIPRRVTQPSVFSPAIATLGLLKD